MNAAQLSDAVEEGLEILKQDYSNKQLIYLLYSLYYSGNCAVSTFLFPRTRGPRRSESRAENGDFRWWASAVELYKCYSITPRQRNPTLFKIAQRTIHWTTMNGNIITEKLLFTVLSHCVIELSFYLNMFLKSYFTNTFSEPEVHEKTTLGETTPEGKLLPGRLIFLLHVM